MDFQEVESLKQDKFDYQKLEALLIELSKDLSDIKLDLYWNVLLEFVKIFKEMGGTLTLAFQDITTKVAIMKKNLTDFGSAEIGLFVCIRKEMELGVHVLNGRNNKKFAASPKYASYISTARTSLRMAWLLDFVTSLLSNIGNSPKASPSDCARKAYATTLATRHSFMLRSIAKIAFAAAPYRQTFDKKVFPGLPSEKTCEAAKNLVSQLEKVRSVVWKFYHENKIADLA